MIIHRAILGSLERFIAVLLENTSGFLPFGLAPRHVAVLPVSTAHSAYAQIVVDELKRVCPAAHVEVMDAATASLGKRVRECVKSRVSMIWTVGDSEVSSSSVSVRWSKSSDATVTPRILPQSCAIQSEIIWDPFFVTLHRPNRYFDFLMLAITSASSFAFRCPLL